MKHSLTLLACLLLLPSLGHGFVQNVTHGYPACIACHVSPNGGGLLTDYGRSLSKELMSTWGVSESFAQPFFGVKNRETVKYGGDIRTLQHYIENKNVEQGRLFPMQQNVEVGVKIDNVMVVGTAGLRQGPDTLPERGQFLSERHYVLWSPSPTSRVRAGKFRQSYGINTPNHTRYIKQNLGFGFLSENYNLEFTQFYETYEVTVGTSLGRIDQPRDTVSEKNVSAHFTHYLQGKSRLGASLLIGESSLQRRFLTGVNAVIPLAEDWILMSEMDFEQKHLSSATQVAVDSFASFLRLGQSPFKGFMWYLLYQNFYSDNNSAVTHLQSPGIGVQWLPIPHVNLQVEYARNTSHSLPGQETHTGFILVHLYL